LFEVTEETNPVPTLLAVNFTPVTAAPVESVIVPRMLA
jgi:hypothetical protein